MLNVLFRVLEIVFYLGMLCYEINHANGLMSPYAEDPITKVYTKWFRYLMSFIMGVVGVFTLMWRVATIWVVIYFFQIKEIVWELARFMIGIHVGLFVFDLILIVITLIYAESKFNVDKNVNP